MARYCTKSDTYSFGLPRGSFPNPARLVKAARAVDDTFLLDEHGFDLNAPVVFRADLGANAALPDPLVSGVTYYAIPVSDSAFQVAATADGAAIDLTSDGVRVLVVPKLDVEGTIEMMSAVVDDMLPGHVVPLTAPYPPVVVLTTAELTAAKLLGYTGAGSRSFGEVLQEARRRLDKWGRGIPVRGENRQKSAALSVSVSRASDSRGWGRYGGIT